MHTCIHTSASCYASCYGIPNEIAHRKTVKKHDQDMF